MLVDTGLGLPDATERVGGGARAARRARSSRSSSRTSTPTTSGPPPTSASSPARRVCQGRLDAAQAGSSGRTTSGRTCSPTGSIERRPGGVTEELIGQGCSTGRSSGPSRSRARRRRRRAPRLGARRRPGPRGRPADAAQGRRPDRRRPPARADHADRRPLAGEPARPARGLPRRARADDRARARRSPTAGTATRSPTRSDGRAS